MHYFNRLSSLCSLFYPRSAIWVVGKGAMGWQGEWKLWKGVIEENGRIGLTFVSQHVHACWHFSAFFRTVWWRRGGRGEWGEKELGRNNTEADERLRLTSYLFHFIINFLGFCQAGKVEEGNKRKSEGRVHLSNIVGKVGESLWFKSCLFCRLALICCNYPPVLSLIYSSSPNYLPFLSFSFHKWFQIFMQAHTS